MKKTINILFALLSISIFSAYGQEACNTAWNSATAYTGGAKISYNGRNYTAAFWTQNQNPAANNGAAGSGQPWVSGSVCGGTSTSATITVPGSIGYGSNLTVSYSAPSNQASAKNWIGVYPPGVIPGTGTNSSAWVYAPNASGSITVTTSGLVPGNYAVWYLHNDGYTVLSGPKNINISTDTRRPVYAIAHRVNTLNGVSAALNHGANAIEIDVCAFWNPNDWRAYHDCPEGGAARPGPSMDSMIDRILSEANAGRKLTLVWLDFKNPNYCGEAQNRSCSVAGLRDKMQRLTVAGIQVLYGFYEYHGGATPDVGGRGWQSLQNRLGPLEGITTTGSLSFAKNAYANFGAGIPVGRRVMDYGDPDITNGFGNCTEASWYTCTELRLASQYRNTGNLAATLSWTATNVDGAYIDKLLGVAGIDGIIVGYRNTEYDDNWQASDSIALVRNWVNSHSSTHRMANNNDRMFR